MIFSVLMTVIAVASSLFIAEMILRLSGKVAVHGLHTVSSEDFEKIPGIFEPDQEFIYRSNPDLPYHITINSLGYRGPEISLRKAAGTIRVLCLGDSNTFGVFVQDNETFPYNLQEVFRNRQMMVEVINGGVGGTSIVDHLYFLKKSINLDPDVVILTFFLNDIPDLGSKEPMYALFEKNRKVKSSSAWSPLYELFRNTALFHLMLKTKAKYRIYESQNSGTENNIGSNQDISVQEAMLRERYEGLLGEMQTYLKKESVKFMFVILPSHHQIGRRTNYSDAHDLRIKWAENIGRQLGIPTVNLLEAFQESDVDKKQLYLLPYDGHPSSLAHEITANVIFENLYSYFPDLFI